MTGQREGRVQVRRRGIGSIAIVVGIGWLAACSSDDSTTGPTRLRTDVVSRTVTFPTSPCRVSGDDVIQNGYGGGLDPVQRSICGVPISLRAVPDTGADCGRCPTLAPILGWSGGTNSTFCSHPSSGSCQVGPVRVARHSQEPATSR